MAMAMRPCISHPQSHRLFTSPKPCGSTPQLLDSASGTILCSEFSSARLQAGAPWDTKMLKPWRVDGGKCWHTMQPRASGLNGVGQKPYTAVMIIPTGTGATIGGFAGDALPVARALSSVVDCLITHPNVLNGAMLYWPMPQTLYVEGFALDRFAEGAWGLQPVHQNRVGLVLDSGIEEELMQRHLQVAEAARATLGLPILEYTVTDAPLQKVLSAMDDEGDGPQSVSNTSQIYLHRRTSSVVENFQVEKWIDQSTGTSTGRLGRQDSLMRAVDTLVQGARVNAIAVVARFPDDSVDEIEDYRHGQGVDVLAGVEAVISHMVVREFQIPCAHAPALAPLPFDSTISPRSAAEELVIAMLDDDPDGLILAERQSQIGHTFLPCVLAGLSRAPQFVRKGNRGRLGTLWADDVDCLLVPCNACGGDGTLALCRQSGHKPLLIAVEENETVLNDTPDKLRLQNVVTVANYWEALGVVAAHKAGVDPQSLRKNKINHLHRRKSSVPSRIGVGSLKRLQSIPVSATAAC